MSSFVRSRAEQIIDMQGKNNEKERGQGAATNAWGKNNKDQIAIAGLTLTVRGKDKDRCSVDKNRGDNYGVI